MKFYAILISLALSSVAWAADPGAETSPAANTAAPAAETAPAVDTAAPAAETAPAADTAAPAADQQSEPAAADQTTAKTDDQAGFSRGSVVRSVFTTQVKDREPVDKLNNDKTHDSQVYFFTELRDMSGQTAIHRWEHNGKVAAEVKFKVRGPRWRVWSSKTFSPNATGEWKVSVINGAGDVIAEDMLDYAGPQQEQAPPAASQAPAEEQIPEQPAASQAPATEQQPAQPASSGDAMPQ